MGCIFSKLLKNKVFFIYVGCHFPEMIVHKIEFPDIGIREIHQAMIAQLELADSVNRCIKWLPELSKYQPVDQYRSDYNDKKSYSGSSYHHLGVCFHPFEGPGYRYLIPLMV